MLCRGFSSVNIFVCAPVTGLKKKKCCIWGKKYKNNLLNHNFIKNSNNTNGTSILGTRRLGNQKTAFPSRSLLCSLIKKFSAVKIKN